MGANDSPGDGESETGAAALGTLAAVEFPKNPVDVRGGDAPTVIRDMDHAFVLLHVCDDLDICRTNSMNGSIVEEVDQCLFEQTLVRLEERYRLGYVDSDPVVLEEVLHFPNGRTDKVGDVAPVRFEFQQAGLQSRHIQKILHQVV